MTTPTVPLNEKAISRARELGVRLGRLESTGNSHLPEWQAEYRQCAQEFKTILNEIVGYSRWWWWTLLASLGLSLFVLSQPTRIFAQIYFPLFPLFLILTMLLESNFRKRRALVSSALAEHVQSSKNTFLLAEATRIERNRRRAEKRQEAKAAREKDERRRVQQSRREEAIRSGIAPELVNPPGPLPGYVSPRDAEFLVAQWIRALGEPTAQVTSFVGDGGVDVESENYLAQVKHYRGKVGPAPIRELVGVSRVDGREPLFFTSGSYTGSAVIFAESSGVALFIYNTMDGTLKGANQQAEDKLGSGL